MRKLISYLFKMIVLFILLLCLNQNNLAQCNIKSNNESFTGLIQPTNSWYMGNSFTACQDGALSVLKILSLDSRTNVSLSFYEGNGVSGSLLATVTNISLNTASTITDYSIIDLSSYNINVTNGNMYTFFFDDLVKIYSNESSMYSAGTYWVTDGSTVEIPERDLYFELSIDEALPVELVSFTARFDKLNEQQNSVVLNWQTATEVNNYGFEIERTSLLPSPYQGEGGEAGRGWEKVGFVEGAGNSNSVKSYSFNDNLDLNLNPNLTLTYRLKQIDLDGKLTYSKEIEVSVENIPSEFALEQNYPNPFNPTTTIKYSVAPVGAENFLPVRLIVYNLLGQEVATLVNKQQSAGNYEVKFDASNLASGIYLYKLQAADYTSVKKLILLK